MPPLTKDEIKDWSLSRVKTEMKIRVDDVKGIQDRSDENKIINADGEDAGKGATIFQDLNLLGERHDELKELETGDAKIAKLTEWLDSPTGQIPDFKDPNNPATKKVLKDAGLLFSESKGYKRYLEDNSEKNFGAEVPFWSLLSAKVLGTDDTLAGVDDEFAPQAIRIPGVRVPVLFQANNVAPLFEQGTTTQNAIVYMAETVTSQGAAETAEGAAKPEADISFAEASSPVQNIPVTLPVTSQLLEDVPFMRAWVSGRLRLFVLNREDSQLLNGTGVAPNLTGILVVAGTNAESYSIAAADADATVAFDAVFRGMTAIQEAFLEPSAHIMAAGTWERFRLGKDGNNNYLLGGAGGEVARRLWGLPVTVNQNMPAEAAAAEPIATVARESAMVARRNQVSLAVTDSHASEFTTNVLRFRAEQRIGFPIFRPAGITVVTSAV
jgi:HK97 family phage major capsid protein